MAYCTKDDINALFGDISDDISDDMFTTVIDNCTAWIEANLKRHYVPIPTNHPQALKTIAIYYGASDILLSLYHGEELPVQYDIWFQKAQDLLDAYIEEALKNPNEEETEGLLGDAHNVKYSKSKPYNRNGTLWQRR
jgi:hypothetical protein